MVARKKPIEEHRRNGNPSKLNNLPDEKDDVEVAPISDTACPQTLGPAGREVWARLTGLQIPWHGETDLDCIRRFCELTDDIAELTNQITTVGYDNCSANQLKALHKAQDDWYKLLTQLGLTPVARSQIGVAIKTKPQKAKLTDFLANKSGAA